VVRKLHPAAELAAYKTAQNKSSVSDEQQERHLRLAAEFDNYKKRTARQFADIIKNANEDLIQELLAVVDDFSRALEAAAGTESPDQMTGNNSILEGMRMIHDKFLAFLKGRGVNRFESMERPFDPQYHDAVMQMPSEKEEGTVIGVISPGYTLNDKVIRHAKVIVASSK
jgi:molecular chaperone GrpE